MPAVEGTFTRTDRHERDRRAKFGQHDNPNAPDPPAKPKAKSQKPKAKSQKPKAKSRRPADEGHIVQQRLAEG